MQCKYAFSAVEEMNRLLQTQNPQESANFFRAAHDFVGHASHVSRMLWPSSRKRGAKERGYALRSSLGVDDSDPLSRRGLRNNLEHFDERLDDWVEQSPNRIYIDNIIGPPEAIGGSAVRDKDILRCYNPGTKEFIFQGVRYDIQELATALDGIAVKARAVLDGTSDA